MVLGLIKHHIIPSRKNMAANIQKNLQLVFTAEMAIRVFERTFLGYIRMLVGGNYKLAYGTFWRSWNSLCNAVVIQLTVMCIVRKMAQCLHCKPEAFETLLSLALLYHTMCSAGQVVHRLIKCNHNTLQEL